MSSKNAKAERMERDIKKLEDRYGTEVVRHRVLTAENTFAATARTVLPKPIVLAPEPEHIETEEEQDELSGQPQLEASAPATAQRPIQRGLLAQYRRRYF